MKDLSGHSVPIRVALFGRNGHQVHRKLEQIRGAALVGICDLPLDALPPAMQACGPSVYPDLDALLGDGRVDLVVMCSAVRGEQAEHAIRALGAGKHVLAEKPCATSLDQLDRLMRAASEARAKGVVFREMAGTALGQPYAAMADLVRSGSLGQIVQVIARKSYRYHDNRPQDSGQHIDGGLLCQAGIHAIRFIEHAAGQRVVAVSAVQTGLGNPVAGGGLHIAGNMNLKLASGGVAVATANYLNPKGFGSWGNDGLQIFGTAGLVESTDDGRRTRLVVGDEDRGPVPTLPAGSSHLQRLIDHLLTGAPMPWSLEEEVHPTRVVLAAAESAARAGDWIQLAPTGRRAEVLCV